MLTNFILSSIKHPLKDHFFSKHNIYNLSLPNFLMAWLVDWLTPIPKKYFYKLRKDLKDLSKDIVSRHEIKLMIENEILKSNVQARQHSEAKNELIPIPETREEELERAMLVKAKKSRPEVIKQAIHRLIDGDMRTTDIYNVIVLEKKMCGKTQFYNYLKLVRTELRVGLRPKVRTELET